MSVLSKELLFLREKNPTDRGLLLSLRGLGALYLLLFAALLATLLVAAWPALKGQGLAFFLSNNWNPVDEQYGILSFIYGTLVTSLLALLMATPPSLLFALFMTELCPKKLVKYFTLIIDTLAAIPSIIYGMWALFVLSPFIRDGLYPLSQKLFPDVVFFQGPSFGIGVLSASLTLALMISPIISSLCIQVFRSVPLDEKQAVLALGGTKWETYWIALIRNSLSGIWGAVILALGRALGETMAVAMVIGNTADIKLSIFATGSTMASVIANEYAEAFGEHTSALTLVSLVLFLMVLLVNLLVQQFILKPKRMHP